MSDLVCGTCHEPIIDGQGRYHPTHRYGKNSPHFHVVCGETDPRDARIAELEAALTVFSARQTVDSMATNEERDDLCKWCGGLKAMRQTMGDHCDHLCWPDNLTDEAKRANGYAPTLTIAWMKTGVTDEEMLDFLANPKP